MACEVLEMIAEELDMGARDIVNRLICDEKSDSCIRVNHYPPCPDLQTLSGRTLIRFGEHTDPQLISVLRSNNESSLQICNRDGAWISIPFDHTTIFFNVGDSLQFQIAVVDDIFRRAAFEREDNAVIVSDGKRRREFVQGIHMV
ncbi:gibberellin 2-beta-dioxygenase [Perilla frutescens var. hirtella]|uniref:Gibberellin 2-beta-dioxygenase n=1 Tax=Perilla frutescens var. hirtella TaxID=608512 RepID=A0AAD4IRE0_PERFH|nr:gibberellin 2-beta-dioxygenase [Perilla frutescens var. hirtella]